MGGNMRFFLGGDKIYDQNTVKSITVKLTDKVSLILNA